MSGHSLTQDLVVGVLRLALVAALFAAGRGVYRRLPDGGEGGQSAANAAGRAEQTLLRVIMRRPPGAPPPAGEVPFQLYSIDITSAQREFDSEPRPGQRFETFMSRRMRARPPVSGQFNAQGEAVVSVTPGRWWIHATLPGREEMTWRLPVNVTGREKTVELRPENAYTRAKSF